MKRAESPTTIREGPFRTIVRRHNFQGVNCPHGGGRTLIAFDCGHSKVVKKSKAPKTDRARCPDCREGVSW